MLLIICTHTIRRNFTYLKQISNIVNKIPIQINFAPNIWISVFKKLGVWFFFFEFINSSSHNLGKNVNIYKYIYILIYYTIWRIIYFSNLLPNNADESSSKIVYKSIKSNSFFNPFLMSFKIQLNKIKIIKIHIIYYCNS